MNIELSYFLEKRQLNIQFKGYEDVSEELLDDINDFCEIYKGVPILLWGQRLVELLDNFSLSGFIIHFEGSSNDYFELKEIVSKYNRFYKKEIKILSLKGYKKELSLKFERMSEFIRQLQKVNFEKI